MPSNLPLSDKLDAATFNELEYINAVFTSEGSLSNLPTFANNITAEIKGLDDSISNAIQNQSEEGGQGKIRLASSCCCVVLCVC